MNDEQSLVEPSMRIWYNLRLPKTRLMLLMTFPCTFRLPKVSLEAVYREGETDRQFASSQRLIRKTRMRQPLGWKKSLGLPSSRGVYVPGDPPFLLRVLETSA